jgi:hypothetical protein
MQVCANERKEWGKRRIRNFLLPQAMMHDNATDIMAMRGRSARTRGARISSDPTIA